MAHVEDRRWSVDPVTNLRKRSTYNGPKPWRVRYRTPDGASRAQSFAKKVDADRFRASVETTKAEGRFVDAKAGRESFREYAKRWLETKVDVRPRTRINLEGRLTNHIYPTFGDRNIASITGEEVRAWVASLAYDKKLAPDTVKATFLTLSQVFATAELDRVIGRTPCLGVKLPKPKVRTEMVYLDHDQVEKLADVIDPRYRALILTAAYCGARAGELEALRVDRVNWLRRRFQVVESLSEVRGALTFGPTKTFETRWVPMPAFVAETLREHVDTYPSDDGLVFTAGEDGPLRHRNFMRRHFRPAVTKAKLPETLRFHDLRHTAAAFMIAEGAQMEQVKKVLGHSTIRVTSDVYGHLFEDHADPLMEALDARRSETRASSSRPGTVTALRA